MGSNRKLSAWTTYRKALIQIDGVARWRKVYVDHQRNERYVEYKTRRYYESEFDSDGSMETTDEPEPR